MKKQYIFLLFASSVLLFISGISFSQTLPDMIPINGPYSQTNHDLGILYRNYTLPTDNPTPPGDTFAPPVSEVTPVSSAPQIATFTKQSKANGTITLTGANFTGYTGTAAGIDTNVWVYTQTSSTNGILFNPEILRKTTHTIVFSLMNGNTALTDPYGMFFVWVQNINGISYPVKVNATESWWIEPDHTQPGQQVSIYGRNLSNKDGTTQSYVYINHGEPGVQRNLHHAVW